MPVESHWWHIKPLIFSKCRYCSLLGDPPDPPQSPAAALSHSNAFPQQVPWKNSHRRGWSGDGQDFPVGYTDFTNLILTTVSSGRTSQSSRMYCRLQFRL